jgi:hypothetical protein
VNQPKRTRKPGRPKLPRGTAKGRIVPVRFNPDDLKLISEAAKVSNHTVSEQIRNTLNRKCFIEVGPEGEELDARTKAIIEKWKADGWVPQDTVNLGGGRRHMWFQKDS